METEKNILIAFILNAVFSLIELIGGFFIGSIAILSDALHDFGDALSIAIAYFLEKKSKQKPNYKYTYGYLRYSVLGSLITALILIVGSVFVIWEAINRIKNPTLINYNGMMFMAIFGIVVNVLATICTSKGKSLNEKLVSLHLLEDVLGWVVVLIGSILMKFTKIDLIDAILSILVAVFIFYEAIKNIKVIGDLFLEKTPAGIEIENLIKEICLIKGVIDVHHVHVRSIDGFNNFATMHVVVEKYDKKIKLKIKEKLMELGIKHSTIELELKNEECISKDCKLNMNISDHH